ncbi:MAG: hypothetical protein K8R89_07865, partial [Anaerolineae bacterium]|nr:hypothetical protein [Anaerolineae bacterium]
ETFLSRPGIVLREVKRKRESSLRGSIRVKVRVFKPHSSFLNLKFAVDWLTLSMARLQMKTGEANGPWVGRCALASSEVALR